MTTSRLELISGVAYRDVTDTQFVKLMLDEELRFARGSTWVTAADLDTVPGELLGRVEYGASGRDEAVTRVEDAVAHLALRERALVCRVAARSERALGRAEAAIRTALPPAKDGDDKVAVRFWWWNGTYPENMARLLPAPRWLDVAENYAADSGRALAGPMAWSAAPPHGGRLLLWHGMPGTGKTTAVRALAHGWRDWADFHFVTDPELFLQHPGYLLRALSQPGPAGRWQVLVLEDAGEYLAPDAKNVAGQALSRLLNVCDGALGQATSSLILVTTNEAAQDLHPAVTRPGRCLSVIEFGALARSEVAGWCAARGVPDLERSHATLAELYAHAAGRPVGEHRRVGFAAAA